MGRYMLTQRYRVVVFMKYHPLGSRDILVVEYLVFYRMPAQRESYIFF
jgi:hypothetical protein